MSFFWDGKLKLYSVLASAISSDNLSAFNLDFVTDISYTFL